MLICTYLSTWWWPKRFRVVKWRSAYNCIHSFGTIITSECTDIICFNIVFFCDGFRWKTTHWQWTNVVFDRILQRYYAEENVPNKTNISAIVSAKRRILPTYLLRDRHKLQLNVLIARNPVTCTWHCKYLS